MNDMTKENISAWAMILFVLLLVVFCSFASLTVLSPEKPTIVSCMDGHISIKQEDSFVPLELSGKPVECHKLVVRY